MPVERRNARMQTTTLIISVVALAAAVVLVVLALRAAGTNNAPQTINPSNERFVVGDAEERARSIRKDGPILFSDVSGNGQNHPVYLLHDGEDAHLNWTIVEAHPPGSPPNCFINWSKERNLFTSCDERTFPADGSGLPHYAWEVSTDGELSIDLRKTVSADGATPVSTTSVVKHAGSTIVITGGASTSTP